MENNVERFIAHCLGEGYISRDRVDSLIEKQAKLATQGKEKSLYILIAQELGWDKERVRVIMKNALQNTKQDGSNEDAGIDAQDDLELPGTESTDISPGGAKSCPGGKKFGNYILVKELGAGGMGTVYKAYHPTLQSYFALKMIQPGKVGKEGVVRLEREARAAFKLRHPNIVHVHDTGIQDKRHYIVMDYIEGKDLNDLIEQDKFWPRRALELVLQIARALEYSHKEGIVHRDIKPSNILVAQKDGKDMPYLVDFGLASVVKEEKLTRSGEIVGTPQYMSPEQAMAMKGIDGRTDVYSLGTVLYEMLSGKPAFKGAHVAMILYNVVSKEPEMLTKLVPGISKEVEAIVMKCLEKERERRYQSAAELADDIERYIRGEAVLATSPSPLSRMWRNIKRNRKLLAVILSAAVLLIGIAALGVIIYYNKTREVEKIKAEAGQKIKDKIAGIWSDINKQESNEEFDNALTLCNTLVDLDPTVAKRVIDITKKKEALSQKKEAQHKEARKYYDRAMETFWNPRLEEKDIKECMDLFDTATKADPSYADAYFQAGRAAHRLFETDKASKYYEKSLKLEPNLTPAKYYLTVIELHKTVNKIISGKASDKDIEKEFNKRWENENISYETKDPYPLLAKAHILLLSRHWDECKKYCDRVVELTPLFPDAYLLRAQVNSYPIVYNDKGAFNGVITFTDNPKDLYKALNDCTMYISLDPCRVEVYILRGWIYETIGAYEPAEKEYKKALILKRLNDPWLYETRTLCYMAMGKPEAAIKDLEKWVEKRKFNKGSGYLATLLKACAGDKKGAEESLRDYISTRHEDFSAYDGFIKGMIYILIDNDTERAVPAFKSFMQISKGLLSSLQLYVKALSKDIPVDQFVNDATFFFKWVPNLFCAPHTLKNSKSFKYLKDISLLFQISGAYVFSRGVLDSLNKNQGGYERLKNIDLVLKQEYPSLTLEFIVYYISYSTEQAKLQQAMTMNELPSASMYYRRAIEYYIKGNIEKAIKDLESALEFEPYLMEVHYGLSTLYSIMGAKDPKSREKALYHLKLAIEYGWSHVEDQTLKDDEFSCLGLGKTVSIDEIRSWDKKRQEREKLTKEFGERVETLLSDGGAIQALQLLYSNSEFSFKLKDTINRAEKEAMNILVKDLTKDKEKDLDNKVESLFGQSGKIAWEWAKEEERLRK